MQSKATSLTIQCTKCKNTKLLACNADFGGAFIPQYCDLQPAVGPGTTSCGPNTFEVLTDRSTYVDQQTLKIQEAPEAVPAGEMPRNLMMVVERNAVQKIVPGSRVTVTGIYSIHQMGQQQGRNSNKAAVAIRQPYVRVIGVDQTHDSARRALSNFSDAEIRN